ncbi:hypothetical protein Bca52824_069111 [Brassica carinata]|uniref:Uncharacterized protein n=1 Tax=Brassica carinata TaxID=52824 RepID=A0A8X7Q3H9_BRACI|nr:hypothetical protein Bca52824_069111 [Brassica carinata]
MLTVSPLVVNTTSRDHYMAADFADFTTEGLPDFTAEEGCLDVLEGIDFYDDLFIEFNGDDVLPDLEIDSYVLGEYSGSGRDEELEMEETLRRRLRHRRDGGWCKPEGTDKTVRKGKRKGKKSKDCLSSDNGIKKTKGEFMYTCFHNKS